MRNLIRALSGRDRGTQWRLNLRIERRNAKELLPRGTQVIVEGRLVRFDAVAGRNLRRRSVTHDVLNVLHMRRFVVVLPCRRKNAKSQREAEVQSAWDRSCANESAVELEPRDGCPDASALLDRSDIASLSKDRPCRTTSDLALRPTTLSGIGAAAPKSTPFPPCDNGVPSGPTIRNRRSQVLYHATVVPALNPRRRLARSRSTSPTATPPHREPSLPGLRPARLVRGRYLRCARLLMFIGTGYRGPLTSLRPFAREPVKASHPYNLGRQPGWRSLKTLLFRP